MRHITTPYLLCRRVPTHTNTLRCLIRVSVCRQPEAHQQLKAVVSVRRVDGEIRVERERRKSVLLVSDADVGPGPGKPSFGDPVSAAPVDAVVIDSDEYIVTSFLVDFPLNP